jgi:hypothetical protein
MAFSLTPSRSWRARSDRRQNRTARLVPAQCGQFWLRAGNAFSGSRQFSYRTIVAIPTPNRAAISARVRPSLQPSQHLMAEV